MKQIIERHTPRFDEIRQLCFECHGLDLTGSSLYSGSSTYTPSPAAEAVLRDLISSKLLNLAVSLRINIYQGNLHNWDAELDGMTAGYYEHPELRYIPITIKDVCDKIIHADTVTKFSWHEKFDPTELNVSMQFQGENRGKRWTLDLGLEQFSEAVLKLLDEVQSEDT